MSLLVWCEPSSQAVSCEQARKNRDLEDSNQELKKTVERLRTQLNSRGRPRQGTNLHLPETSNLHPEMRPRVAVSPSLVTTPI